MEDAGASILSCYDMYIKNHPTALHQSVALQLLFDVRFIAALLGAKDKVRALHRNGNQDCKYLLQALQERVRSLCECLEGQVDPFDLDVFKPHIQNHVNRAVQRLQVPVNRIDMVMKSTYVCSSSYLVLCSLPNAMQSFRQLDSPTQSRINRPSLPPLSLWLPLPHASSCCRSGA